MKKIFLLLLVLLTVPYNKSYSAIDKKAEIAKLRNTLSAMKSSKDSIRILYDIFDLSSGDDRLMVGRELSGVAKRSNMNNVVLDMARHMSNLTRNDSIINGILKDVSKMPDSKERRETQLFIKIRRIALSSYYLNEIERHNKLTKAMALNDDYHSDTHSRILQLYTICEYLPKLSQSHILPKYMAELGNVMKKSGIENYSLWNIFYNESANIYSEAGNASQAVAADRKLLQIVDDMEKKYNAQGRKYRNFDLYRFNIYRRLLSNYKALSLEEANDIYEKVLALEAVNPEVKATAETKKRPAVYHAMKNGRYAEAVAYARCALRVDDSLRIKKHILEILKEAAMKIGDQTNVDIAEDELTALKAQFNVDEARQRVEELTILYDVNKLRAENLALARGALAQKEKSARNMMIYVIVGWSAFIIIVVALLFWWTRYRRVKQDILTFVNSLSEERDKIKERQYSDYYEAMAMRGEDPHPKELDASKLLPDPKPDSLDEAVDYIINDIMFIASVAFEDSRKYNREISVTEFMKESVESLKPYLNKSVNLTIAYPEKDFKMRVDEECLRMIVNHILKIAVYLTPEGGDVGFKCNEHKEVNRAQFEFTHSGYLLPPGKEERIFRDFFNYRRIVKRGGGAMLMVRMINLLTNSILRSWPERGKKGKLVLAVPLS